MYSQDVGKEFGIKKCAMLIIKGGRRETTERGKLSNQEGIRTLGEKENYKYLGILKADTIKLAKMEEKKKKRVPQENKKASRNQALQEK